ncbi:MAG: MotA/TolQ/ExbB proton channel family protein [Novosphingobium sp.]|nr:MotA/TolQ/ExbB proton channel family protein [Novosphingobium sp.]MCP5401057.1 MotA/TolQ/ExbB proton channel family protein [Novosphingobium sp.]
MNVFSLVDPVAAAIVIGGTLVATVLRSGFADCGQALAALAAIGKPRFDAQGVRAELAIQVREIHRDGVFRASPHHMGDSEFDEATDALLAKRSVPALLDAHEAHKRRRIEANERAVQTLVQAAELAPVFGLVGTLYSLSQLAAVGIGKDAFAGAISTAVLTTLYGLLFANLLLAPLARMVERAAAREEKERQKIVDWLARQVAQDLPHRKPVELAEAV